MTLVSTVAGATANSYLTVADADGFAQDLGLGPSDAAWLVASNSDKEKALIRATSEVDAYLKIAGSHWADGQALLFPRAIDADNTNTPFILTNVELATYAQAVHVLRNAEQLDNADSRRARGLISFSDDDGSGSVISNRDDFGTMSSRAIHYLRALKGLGRTTLRSVWVSGSQPMRRVYGANSRP